MSDRYKYHKFTAVHRPQYSRTKQKRVSIWEKLRNALQVVIVCVAFWSAFWMLVISITK